MNETISKKPGRPRKERNEAEALASTEPQRQRIQIQLDPTHPIEGCILEAYNSRKYFPDGGDYISGIDVLRRALVLGWNQLVTRNTGAYPTLVTGRAAAVPENSPTAFRGPAATAAVASAPSPLPARQNWQIADDDAFGTAPV